MEFQEFPKIHRLNREIIITEKLDGTNAQICIESVTSGDGAIAEVDGYGLWAGSRSRWVRPGSTDNFGFAWWVRENAAELVKLGVGRHFGEWWGKGIQRGYGLDGRRFSLFNTTRWNKDNIPSCVSVIPQLYRGPFSEEDITVNLDALNHNGSFAAPGFMKPEGIVIYHTAANVGFKITLENDAIPKSLIKE